MQERKPQAQVKITDHTIDKGTFERMIRLGMSDTDIVDYCMVTTAKLYAWIKLVYKTKKPMLFLKRLRAQAKMLFLESQMKLSDKNSAESIWLGKNYFGQTDKDKEVNKDGDIEDLTPLADLLTKGSRNSNNGQDSND